ncbi:ABC transporter permease [Aurantimonas sp. MSK8Z-1]|uniref:ABC transporter permease n=1 Tax=Mangrovibrevibacter kandeliae TaxID=2968473 RepID=UPI0021177B4A|nr:ABC transporter permease [Aurantimonas sp. MSK8Z-1]MCW4115196.1 ABC transporter permease [Aurantimonas sp. MSK8Z-1]
MVEQALPESTVTLAPHAIGTTSRRHLSGLSLLLREPRVLLAGAFLLLLLVAALVAPAVAPHDPLEQDLMLNTLPPAWDSEAEPGYLLGTDSLGRDVLSRLIYGGRVAFTVAIVAALAAGVIGTTLGLVAGYFGGWVDAAISRVIDIWMAFPPVLLSILLVAVIGTGVTSVILAIVVIDWTRFCRVVRSETLQQAKMEYVDAAVTLGTGRWRILLKEILPNVLPVVVVLLSLEMGIAVIVEAVLSFVGLSVSSDTPTWGGMIAEGRQIIYQAWWVLVFPLVLLFATVLAFNQLGDGIRRLTDPVLRR